MKMDVSKYIPKGISLKMGRQILLTKKHSPTILFGVGVVGVVATVVLASRATLELEDILDEAESNLSKAKSLNKSQHPDYSDESFKKDVVLIYAKTAGAITKLYGPSLILGVLSISSISGSHYILTKRNAGLVAAYSALQKGFDEYRARVLKELGPDKERELHYGSETVEIVEDTKKGSKVTKVTRVSPTGGSVYSRFFEKGASTSWSPDPVYNFAFLHVQQEYANHMLQTRGHVLLNDVFDGLGLERTPAGAVVGWVKDSENGDNYVDFGIFPNSTLQVYDFVRGRDGSILVDFNVDGEVFKLIGKNKQ